jgi:hypothetical protein
MNEDKLGSRSIKMRLDSIQTTLLGKNPFPAFIAFEHCYLQLRMICECIALACLSVHGDIPATQSKRLTKEYAADDILRELEKLHPRFYPVPAFIKELDVERKLFSTKPTNIADFLTKSALLALYWECGSVLHRGTLRKMRDGATDDWNKVTKYTRQIIDLLDQHLIQLSNPDEIFGVTMISARHGGEVFANVLNASLVREIIQGHKKPTV